MPIYFVVAEQIMQPYLRFNVWKIIKTIECSIDDIDKIYHTEVVPLLQGSGRNIQAMYFYREPPNPFSGNSVTRKEL